MGREGASLGALPGHGNYTCFSEAGASPVGNTGGISPHSPAPLCAGRN